MNKRIFNVIWENSYFFFLTIHFIPQFECCGAKNGSVDWNWNSTSTFQTTSLENVNAHNIIMNIERKCFANRINCYNNLLSVFLDFKLGLKVAGCME